MPGRIGISMSLILCDWLRSYHAVIQRERIPVDELSHVQKLKIQWPRVCQDLFSTDIRQEGGGQVGKETDMDVPIGPRFSRSVSRGLARLPPLTGGISNCLSPRKQLRKLVHHIRLAPIRNEGIVQNNYKSFLSDKVFMKARVSLTLGWRPESYLSKEGRSVQMCSDYRELNKLTELVPIEVSLKEFRRIAKSIQTYSEMNQVRLGEKEENGLPFDKAAKRCSAPNLLYLKGAEDLCGIRDASTQKRLSCGVMRKERGLTTLTTVKSSREELHALHDIGAWTQLTGPELIQETTEKIVLIKVKDARAQDRQKSYADRKRKSRWVRQLETELCSRSHLGKKDRTKCYADEPLVMPLEGIHVDDKLQFVEEPVEIMEREIKRLKRSGYPLLRVRWNY
ncbi:hypothetical protein Tco_0409555 [Tanacetum coccineum]